MSSSTDDGPMTGPKHHPQQPFNVAACTACFRLQAPIKTQRKGQQYSQMRTIECSQATKKGHANVGEKRTHETHSVCPSLSSEAMVYLGSPRVFQSLMVLSRDPETIWRLSTEKATERTSFSCPIKRRVVFPELISQRRRVPSQAPLKANCPSLLMTTSDTKWERPRRAQRATSVSVSAVFARVSELPDEDALVARRRKDQVWVFHSRGDTGHSVAVALEGAAGASTFQT